MNEAILTKFQQQNTCCQLVSIPCVRYANFPKCVLLAAAILDSLKVAYFRMNTEILTQFQVRTPGTNLYRPDWSEMQIFRNSYHDGRHVVFTKMSIVSRQMQ